MSDNNQHLKITGTCLLVATFALSSWCSSAAQAQFGGGTPVELAAIEIIYLKHAAANDVAKAVSQVFAQRNSQKVDIVPEERLNAVVVSAPKEAQREIMELIAALDKDQVALEQQVKIFDLQHATPSPSLLQTLSSMLDPSTQLSYDTERNIVLAVGTPSSLSVIEAALLRIDEKPTLREQAARRKPQDRQVRIVWLVADLKDDAAPDPPKDLENVVKELERIGITNVKMAAQLMVNAMEGEQFDASGSTSMFPPFKCNVEVSGMIFDPRTGPSSTAAANDEPVLQLGVVAQTVESREAINLCQLETVIRAPVGQSVVLGVTPIDSRQSAFVVQLIARDSGK